VTVCLFLAVGQVEAESRWFDLGAGGDDLAKGYVAVGADQVYSAVKGYGWRATRAQRVRFSYWDDFVDSSKWKKDATRVQGNSTLVSPRYRGHVGAFPCEHEGLFVYEFRFPLPIESLEIRDDHVIWPGGSKANRVTMWTSDDGKAWTQRHNDPRKGSHHQYNADLSHEFAGKTTLFVKYLFFAGDERRPAEDPRGAALCDFAITGTLRGRLPDDFDRRQSIAAISADPLNDGPFVGQGDALVRDGVTVNVGADFGVDLPAGRYYIETLSNQVPYDLVVGDRTINSPNRVRWRDRDGQRTVAGRTQHPGGTLSLRIRGKGKPIRLCAIRMLPDSAGRSPARFESGRIVLEGGSNDPAVKSGLRVLEEAGFVHSPDVCAEAIERFVQVRDPDLRAALQVLGGVPPNMHRDDENLKRVQNALLDILANHRENITARDLLDDLDRVVLGDHKYRHFYWDDVGPDSILYPMMRMLQGRYGYHEFMERGRSQDLHDRFKPIIEDVKRSYPNDPFVHMYNLERVRWGDEYTDGTDGAPRWAMLQRELLARAIHVFHWWIDNRQRRDGSFGGGLNDDVEALRSWPIAILALNDPKSQAAAQKLSDGIWRSGVLEHGYSRHRWDIQHSAEESSDTQPQFIGVRYGDPEWIWRNIEPLVSMRDVWTGINSLGQRHFKSAYVSATEIDTSGTRGVDVPYATRAVKHGHWVAWYADIPEVRQLMTEWARAWAVASMRSDRGKPKGVPPAAVDFQTGQLGGKGPNWYTPNLGWTYFNWPGKVDSILDHLLVAYTLTGDESFVEPFAAILDMVRRNKDAPIEGAKPGSEAWAAAVLLGKNKDPSSRSIFPEAGALWGVFGKWRILTGDKRFDDLLGEVGDAYTRLYLTGDTRPLEDVLLAALEKGVNRWGLGAMRYNLPMLTSEVKYTDRIFVGGHDVLFAMYTGSPGAAVYCPSYAVTWQDTGTDFAALVTLADRERLKVTAYSFDEQPKRIGMLVWRMPRGKYRLALSSRSGSTPLETREVSIEEKGDRVELMIPPKQVVDIGLRLLETHEIQRPLPDVAVAARDMTVSPKEFAPGQEIRIGAKVHNIGSTDAEECRVRFLAIDDNGTTEIGHIDLGDLPRSRGLQPSMRTVALDCQVPDPKPSCIRIEVTCKGPQIATRNDFAERKL